MSRPRSHPERLVQTPSEYRRELIATVLAVLAGALIVGIGAAIDLGWIVL